MSTHIIHPTDFSDNSLVALDHAIHLAKAYDCELLLVHSINWGKLDDYHRAGRSLLTKSEAIEKDAKEQLTRLGEKVITKGIQCKAQLYNGSLTAWLPDMIKKENPKMVVMGTTGAGSLGNKVFGSNTYAIMRSSAVPVLAVPSNTKYSKPENIVLAANLKTPDHEAIKFMTEFAAVTASKLKVVYVESPNEKQLTEETISQLKTELKNIKAHEHVAYETVENNNYIQGIGEYVTQNEPDIFSMVMSDKNFIEKFIYGSLSEQLIHNSKVPVLVVPKGFRN